MKLHLYEFYIDGSLADESIYVVSSLDPKEVRKFITIWDHGGYDADLFYKTIETGDVREITQLEDAVRDICPYNTDERVFCEELGGDFLDIDTDIQGFFEEYYGKEYPE